MSTNSDHIPFALIVDLAEGRATHTDLMRAHVAACPQCGAALSWAERTIGLMRSDVSEDAPADAIARAKRLFATRQTAREAPARQRLAAALQFDSFQTPLAIGVRTATQQERQMLFTAAEFTLDLRIAPAETLWSVSGQILGAEDGNHVELNGPAGAIRSDLNDLCEFTLPPVPSGNYSLNAQLGDLDIEIIGLQIGA